MSDDMGPEAEDAGGDQDIEALKAESAALKEQVLRYAAEAENTRRRAEREANDARAYAIQKFARDLLGVADNLARALAHQPPDTGDAAVKNFVLGVEMTEKELQAAFDRNGLRKIHPNKGDKFDPHQHQAMMELAETDVAPGAVVEVMQSGYDLLGRLVRPAMVVVAAKGAKAGKPNGADGTANPYAANEDDDPGGSVDTRA
ncbi:MAG TPA: nucleotide exchange factor GrpE [Phenylobacterium sp.]|jgi:molecular chaperone GrpE|nr:nucleotide exchange factor GrpE [Phenylobacterium sp.]